MLIASPAVSDAQPRLKRRVRGMALSYLVLGAAGALVGGAALFATLRRALPRTRKNVQEAVDALRERL